MIGEKAEINRALKEAVKRSSLEFGNESIRYESVMAEEMKRQGVVVNSSDYTQRYGTVRYSTYCISMHVRTDREKYFNPDLIRKILCFLSK